MKKFKRNYQAEAELPFLKDLGDLVDAMRAVCDELKNPSGAATAVTSTPQDEPVPSQPKTAGLGPLPRVLH